MKSVVVYEGTSEYGEYRIVDKLYEGRPARVLFSDKNVPQSGVALDDEPDLLFDYNQRFLEIAASVQPASVLVIGGGMMTLPTALSQHFPKATIDVVEIDSLLPRLAKQYFGAIDNAHIRVHIADGRDYMATCRAQYDLIIIDAFSGFTIAHPLLSAVIAKRYADCLTPSGVVAVNFIAKYYTRKQSLAHELQQAFSGAFSQLEFYPADHQYSKHAEQNIVLVATQTSPALDYLRSAPVTLLELN